MVCFTVITVESMFLQVILVSITYCGYIVVAVVSIAGFVIVEQESKFKRTFSLFPWFDDRETHLYYFCQAKQ